MTIAKDELYRAVNEHHDVGVAFENAVNAAIKVATEPNFFSRHRRVA
ncbi:MAG: hypothetical protein ACLPTZ_03080 [Beijerinckiaceae bacterium]